MQVTGRVGGCLRHTRDLLAASDPGLARLRTATSGAGAMITALGVEYLVARLRGLDAQSMLVAMLLGAVVAMVGSMALSSERGWAKVGIAGGFPIAIGVGLGAGVAVAGRELLMLTLFVVVMFVAVFVRRFGPAYFFYGFMLWMGYFFSSFLHATVSQIPGLLVVAVIGSAWVLVLSLTVLRTNPRRVLVRIRRSFAARGRRMAATVTDLLLTPSSDAAQRARLRRRLHSQQAQLTEAGLMIEAWSAMPGALPAGWTGQALRRRVLDVQLALELLAGAGEELTEAPGDVRHAAARVTALFAAGDRAGVRAELSRLTGTTRGEARLTAAAGEWLRLMDEAGTPPPVEPCERGEDGEFAPAVELAMGNLPGSVAVARDVGVRGHRLNPLLRLEFTTRQGVQVALAGALAIVVGRQLDTTRYYWAVIAAFVAFAGTGTRTETFLKSGYRVVGTLVGLLAAVALVDATQGNIGWILFTIVAAMFCGFYLVQINYAYMIFFITIAVAQLYSALHEFSDHLLVLRLEETTVGAAAGIAVALLVAPLSTRDTVKAAQRDLYADLAAFLDAVSSGADPLRTGQRVPDAVEQTGDDGSESHVVGLDALMRAVDNQMRDLSLVAAPLSRPLLLGNDPRLVRHQLTLASQVVRSARLLGAASRGPVQVDDDVRRACADLAQALRLMAENPTAFGLPITTADPRLQDLLDRGESAVLSGRPGTYGSTVRSGVRADNELSGQGVSRAHHALVRLQAALRGLALPANAGNEANLDPDAARETTVGEEPASAPVPTCAVGCVDDRGAERP